MVKDNAITIKNLSKSFRLPHDKTNSIKSGLIAFARRGRQSYETQQVLQDVSFEIKPGEFFGIVGRNGSGKSTLLKLLAGIYSPDEGLVSVKGSLTPFIELGVGFSPELSGRDNVYLNGALLGFSRNEMEAMYNDIVAFAELEKFMDQKLKNYSSGMQVRLAFSIAIRAKSDILLLDEVLAVGDEAFQRKCYEYFEDLKRNGQTVILVTHDMGAVENFCDRAILIEQGVIAHEGKPEDIAKQYRKLFAKEEPLEIIEDTPTEEAPVTRWGDGPLQFGEITSSITDERITIQTTLTSDVAYSGDVTIAYTIKSRSGESLFGASMKTSVDLKDGGQVAKNFSFLNILSDGAYFVDISLRRKGTMNYSDFWSDCLTFKVRGRGQNALHILVDTALDG